MEIRLNILCSVILICDLDLQLDQLGQTLFFTFDDGHFIKTDSFLINDHFLGFNPIIPSFKE